MKTIDKVITKLSCKYGAPMGRGNKTPDYKYTIIDTEGSRKHLVNTDTKESKVIFDCLVPMDSSGAYDKGGAYWGIGKQLRVSYTKDLSYINFYRS